MAEVKCYVEYCRHHNSSDNECNLSRVEIDDGEFTAAGFMPLCMNYEEDGGKLAGESGQG